MTLELQLRCLERNIVGKIDEELKKTGKCATFLLSIWKLISFYYHQSYNN